MYLNVYVPHLQFAAGLLGYIQRQLGLPIASTAPLAKITVGCQVKGTTSGLVLP
jgi:hypothetical protein